MSNDKQQSKIKWSELSEEQKKEIGILAAKTWIELQKKYHKEMMEDIFTPFWIKWMYRIKCKLGFHDWRSLNYSGYSSIVECRKCEKIHTIKHK
jgi:hypothetical protein